MPVTDTINALPIAVLPGDGIGPEVAGAAVEVLEALAKRDLSLAFDYVEHPVGAGEFLRGGDPLPEASFDACRGLTRCCWERKKCPLVDKANVLPPMVFFRRIFDEVGEGFPDVEREHVYVDAMALFMVRCGIKPVDELDSTEILPLPVVR